MTPYSRDRQIDKPGIAGARWWHDALADQDAQIARRAAIRNILIAGGVIAGFGAMLAMCIKVGAGAPSSSSGDLPSDVTANRKTSLEMQLAYGWSFGAYTEPLVFNGITTEPFKSRALTSLVSELTPDNVATRKYAQSTLFDAPNAYPTQIASLDPDEQAGFTKLSVVMQPIHSPQMDSAYGKGKALAGLFAASPGAKAILIVDLNGPAAVAFAAGASEAFEPVFLFDNWPHPRGVVRSHETLSATMYYQPRFADTKSKGAVSPRPAMFVLDRNRLTTYTDDATQFDNRWIAKLPITQAEIISLGATHVLYVCPEGTKDPFELDDVNDELVAYAKGGVDVKALSLDFFAQEGADSGVSDPAYYYGGSHLSHHAFFVDYPWAKPAQAATARPAVNPGKSYVPTSRKTLYSAGPLDRTRVPPPSFGTVPVIIAVGTGVILGARYSRSGSWNRSSSSWGGG